MKEIKLNSIGQVNAYLRSKGIPPQTIKTIREALINDAIQQADALKYNRELSLMAYVLRFRLGFGQKRILRFLHWYDDISAEVADGARTWPELMKELQDETGIEVRTTESFSEVNEDIMVGSEEEKEVLQWAVGKRSYHRQTSQ